MRPPNLKPDSQADSLDSQTLEMLQRLVRSRAYRALTRVLLLRSSHNRASLCRLSPLQLSDQERMAQLQGEEAVLDWMLTGKWMKDAARAQVVSEKKRLELMRRNYNDLEDDDE